MTDKAVIAVVGGTGKLGAAIARRLAKAGRTVIIGSRSPESAQAAASELGFGLTGQSNADAAKAGNIVIVTVPFSAQDATLAEIRPFVEGKIVVDTTVPLVVSAFHNVAAHKLATDVDIDCDVLVFGDDKAARGKVVELASQAGLRGVHGGALVNSAAAEALTSILIFVNRTYQVDGAGIRITGPLIEPE
ncbi:MAG: prephenate dehydrogenase/arogenate dehydrogenase family protein [Novosphingobium sp.]